MPSRRRFNRRSGRRFRRSNYGNSNRVTGRSGQINSLPLRNRRRRRRGGPLARLARQIGRIQQAVETKYIDTSIADATPSWNGSMGIFNDPGQDITDQSRIGDSIFMKYLEMRFKYDENGSGSSGVRIIILLDFENVITSTNQVLGSTGSAQALLSNYIWDRRFRRKILYDRVFHCDGVQQKSVFGTFKIRIPYRVQFSAATTTIYTNALQIMHITDIGAATYPVLTGAVRIAYADI